VNNETIDKLIALKNNLWEEKLTLENKLEIAVKALEFMPYCSSVPVCVSVAEKALKDIKGE